MREPRNVADRLAAVTGQRLETAHFADMSQAVSKSTGATGKLAAAYADVLTDVQAGRPDHGSP